MFEKKTIYIVVEDKMYYPYVEEFDDFEEAEEAFNNYCGDYHTTYLAKVIKKDKTKIIYKNG